MPDSQINVAPDGTGKPIDNTTVTTQAPAGTVYRQTVSIGDYAAGSARAAVDMVAGLAVYEGEARRQVLLMRQQLYVLAAGANGFVPYETPSIGA
jgi:hypothetical protein